MRRERGDRRVILLRFVHKLPVTNRTGTLAIEMPAASIPIKHRLSRAGARFPKRILPEFIPKFYGYAGYSLHFETSVSHFEHQRTRTEQRQNLETIYLAAALCSAIRQYSE